MPFLKYFFFLSVLLSTGNISSQDLPVMAFHGVPPSYTGVDRFLQMKEAGFNINMTAYENNFQAEQALDAAYQAGVKILLLTPELIHETTNTVLRFRDHPALFGYFVSDEPSVTQFGEVSAKSKEIKNLDPFHPTYVNLFPNYAENSVLNASSYDDYLSRYITRVPFDFLSFDNYPLMNNSIHKDWFANLELIRNASITTKKDFWAFANATVFGTYKQPTLAGLKLQVFGNLLYGAQGIQYFTYWTLNDENWRKNKFGKSMVDERGRPTSTYYLVKRVNSLVQKYATVFKGSKVTSVYHTDAEIPAKTRKLPRSIPGMQNLNIGGPAVVSYINNNGGSYVAILNKDLYKPIMLSFTSTASMQLLDNTAKPRRVEKRRKIKSTIDPGDILIFKL